MKGQPAKPKGREDTRRNRVVAMVYDAQLEKLQRLAINQDLPMSTVVFELLARGLAKVPMPRKKRARK